MSDEGRSSRQERRLDQAARAAWLYYVAGNTQDAIAEKLNISRQVVQRLVSLAVTEKLIKFRLDHPLARAMELAADLADRFALARCDVAPTDPAAESDPRGVAAVAADRVATWLGQRAPLVLALSTGRFLRAMVAETPLLTSPQHKIVSLVGAITRDGQATTYEVVMRLADRTGAQCFPMPTPVITSSVEERRLLQTQRSYAVVRELAHQAAAAFVGIGEIGWQAPLHRDGIVNDREIALLVQQGAVGEISGWAFDAEGRILEGGINDRVAGIPPRELAAERVTAVAAGRSKVAAIRAALEGGLVGGLVTDERTAVALLDQR